MTPKPPHLAQKFFSWYCRNQLHDSILGDLDERFYQHLNKSGLRWAQIKYWIGVFSFISRFTLKRDQNRLVKHHNPLLMFRNNLVSSLRFLNRNRGFALINSLGLTIGLTSFLFILFFVNHELSFDSFHPNKNNIYRVNFAFEDGSGNKTFLVNSPPAFAPGALEKFPEMKKISRMRYTSNCLLSQGDRQFYEDHGYYADSLFLEILKFHFLHGDPMTALDEPNSIVLTKELAIKYFGNSNIIGSTLSLNNSTPLKITGILSNIPSNSHLNFDFLISFTTYVVPDGYASDLTSWDWLGFYTYLELENHADPLQFQDKLTKLFQEIHPDDDNPIKPIVQNLSDIYLGSNNMTDDVASHLRSNSKLTVYSLMAIAILILVIAGFNFSNLSNAISINRIKAIGIRKVLGANKHTVIAQLLTESLLITLGCLLLAYTLSTLLFPKIAVLLEWDIILTTSDILATFPAMIVIGLLLGIFSGLYPSLLLSGFNITRALKGESKTANNSAFQFKHILVLLQFAISIGLISTTFVLTQQIDFLRNQTTGFDKENVAIIKLLPEDMFHYFKVYKEQLMQNSAILSVSRGDRVIGEAWPFSGILPTDESPEQGKMIFFNLVDHDYFKTMDIKLIQGRAFSEKYTRDSLDAVVINQKAASYLGMDNPIGRQVHFFDVQGPRTIVGIVEDFNYTSLHQEIGPVAMILPFIDLEYIHVRIAPDNLIENIELMEDTWSQVAPGAPMEWRFLDDKLDQLYKSEAKLSNLVRGFSILAVFLACLGLYGMVTFMINHRIKELGVRKVLGASVISLNILFLKKHIYQILIAMVLVAPILHYYLNTWLEEFAYRIAVKWWVYPVATLSVMVVALITVVFQTIKASKANPANVLRSE